MEYYKDKHITIYNADCRSMEELGDESVQCVVTSPPYWGLRKYAGLPDLIWGEPSSDEPCRHQWIIKRTARPSGSGGKPSPTNPYAYKLATHGTDNYSEYVDYHDRATYTNICSLCGAWKGAYGLEPTPEMYIEHTIEILREIRRVLRKDGVVFWNIGDSYWSDTLKSGKGLENERVMSAGAGKQLPAYTDFYSERPKRLKPKDLCLIPFRVAIAAQEDGWWVRSVIIWSKPNPMPESVTDRPTESHEYILLLTKSSKYYWDMEAVREPQSPLTLEIGSHYRNGMRHHKPNPKAVEGGMRAVDRAFDIGGRNLRSVWTFPTQSYPKAHFATFPERLPEICIKATTPEVGCCSKCGAPWERIVQTTRMGKPREQTKWAPGSEYGPSVKSTLEGCAEGAGSFSETLGWQPHCKCNADKIPSIVLDPFAGSGTTGWVAKKLNRRCVLYELSEEYCALSIDRCRQQGLL